MEADYPGLKAWRLRKGVRLDTIAQATKLSISQLEAIECGEFRKLPGGIYTTSYIRQYARAIDFDEAELIGWYQQSCRTATKEGKPASRSSSRIFGPLLQN